jgi:hypothetical protein
MGRAERTERAENGEAVMTNGMAVAAATVATERVRAYYPNNRGSGASTDIFKRPALY